MEGMSARGRNPTFLIVGAMKAGTTSLYEVLLRHPEVYLPGVKEPNTLRTDEVDSPEGFAAYRALFAGAGSALAVGEASTNYTKRHEFGDGIAERAHRLLGPDLSIIYVVRDPLRRLVSHVNHERLAGRLTDPVGAITLESGAVQTSRYYYQIEPWLELFGPRRVQVVDLAKLRTDPAALPAIYQHLGVDPSLGPAHLNHTHATDGKRVESPWLRRNVTGAAWYNNHLRGRLPARLRQSLRAALVRRTDLPMLNESDMRLAPGVVDELNNQLRLLEDATGVHLDPITPFQENATSTTAGDTQIGSRPRPRPGDSR